MMSKACFVGAASLAPSLVAASFSKDGAISSANPVRKVITMLESMKGRVEAEGQKEKELFDHYMCYCKNGASDLTASIKSAGIKAPALASDIEESQAQLAQTKNELKQAQSDRSAAKSAMAAALANREREAAEFAKTKAEYDATINAITKAVAALEKGMSGAFLQTAEAKLLQSLAVGKQEMSENDRDGLLSFLSGGQGSDYTPSSGEVTGILKQMGDTMADSLAKATSAEQKAIQENASLMAAKTKEVDVLTTAIETKTVRIGDLGVSIVQMQNDLTDTEAALVEDQKFLAGLDTSCKTKQEEWTGIVQTRADEIVAITETIKILSDDDALEMFKKTLPGGGSSFLQLASNAAARSQALAILAGAKQQVGRPQRTTIDLVAVALHGKSADFAKVIVLIDDMVKILKEEQLDDDHKQEYCHMALDQADDKKKQVERALGDAEASIGSAEEGISTVTEEIAALEKGIKALDKAVVEATEQRREEHDDFVKLSAADSAAKELLGFAKNRLNKFYNKKLYKAPPKEELSRQDRIVANLGGGAVFAQISQHARRTVALPAAPQAPGAYKSKTEESSGVIAMVDLLIKDLDKELTESQTAEKEAQKDYEELMRDSAEKRATDSSSLTDRVAAKASLEADLQTQRDAKRSATKELMATAEYTASLHAECDWLLQYYSERKAAREGEVDALKRAKDVLSGADYSLMQRGAQTLLTHSK